MHEAGQLPGNISPREAELVIKDHKWQHHPFN